MKTLRWWQKTIAYEIYVNSFRDSDGDGYGDLNGIRSQLDHLQSLGVGAVWLTPVFESPMVDNGYDVADYTRINPRYGTMEEMEKLIAEAGERGIKVVMDLVFNHTSDQCPWFLESRKSRDNAYSDWYIWRDPRDDGGIPNNWRAIFGGSVWTWCEERQQYYMHTFAEQQPDLNWESPAVRRALFDVARFWIDKGAGGFRMDAIPYIKKPEDFSDGPVDGVDWLSSVHDRTVNTPGILDFLHEFKREVTDGRDVFTVGEANGIRPEDLKDWVGEKGVFDMLFEFSHVNLEFDGAETWCKAKPWTLKDLKKALTASQEATASNGWYPIFFENHDKPRSVNHYFGDRADPAAAAKALGTVLLTLRGTPFIYQGEELGMTNVKWESPDDYNDLNTRSQYEIALENKLTHDQAMACVHRFSRDNARTPIPWNAGEHAGFTTGTPWLPVNADYACVNAQSEAADPDSVLSWYRALVALRKAHPALTEGSYREIGRENDKVYAFLRECPGERILVAVNFSDKKAEFAWPEAGSGEVLLDSVPADGDGDGGVLRPYEAVIVRLP